MRPDDVYPLTEDKQCWSAVRASNGKQSRSVNKSTEIPLDVLGSKSPLNSSSPKFPLPTTTYAELFHKVEEFRLFTPDHTVAVFLARECSVADLLAVIAHCFGNDISNVGVFLYEFRSECLELTDHI